MAGIKSINELKPPLNPDVNVPKIATQAIGEPEKPTTTLYTPDEVVNIVLWGDKLFVAVKNGVYFLNDNAIFQRMKFEIVEEKENE